MKFHCATLKVDNTLAVISAPYPALSSTAVYQRNTNAANIANLVALKFQLAQDRSNAKAQPKRAPML